MSNGVKTLVTLLALTCVLLLAAIWGLSALTKPFPGKTDAPICVDQTISKGDKLFPSDVVVSVDNAGDRNGLAGRTLGLLASRATPATHPRTPTSRTPRSGPPSRRTRPSSC